VRDAVLATSCCNGKSPASTNRRRGAFSLLGWLKRVKAWAARHLAASCVISDGLDCVTAMPCFISGTYHAFDFGKYGHRYLAEVQYRYKRALRALGHPGAVPVRCRSDRKTNSGDAQDGG
jgi:hypothetical protein